MKIGNQIRHRRTELNLSRGELANKIQVTPSAIANYENGVSYPKPDILVALMNALDVDANYLYWNYLSNSTIQRLYRKVLSPEEKESILKYRELSENGKSLVRLIIDEEYKRMNQSEYINLPFYRPGIRKVHSGFLFQDTTQTIRVRRKHVPKDSDFCFQVLIDRYQPVFQKMIFWHCSVSMPHTMKSDFSGSTASTISGSSPRKAASAGFVLSM